MAQPYRNVGAIESTGALVSATDQTGAALDYDAVNGYAQITAKASGVGASLGLRFRAVVAGVLTTLLAFAPGSTTAAFAAGITTPGRITSTVAGTSLRLAYDGTNVVDFAVSSVGGLTITPMANQKVSVTGFAASGLTSFSAQTRVGDLFRVESVASPNVTGLQGAGVEIRYDPTAKGIIKAYDYNLATNVPLTLVASSYAITGGNVTYDPGLTLTLGGTSGTVFKPKTTYDGLGIVPQETASLATTQTVEVDGGTSVCAALIISSNGDVALGAIAGGNHATSITAIRGSWSTVQGTSGTNLYWNAGTSKYRLENNTGGTLVYSIMKIGTTVAM